MHSSLRGVILTLSLVTLAGGLDAQRGRGISLPGWISEDLPRAVEAAKATGKPLLIAFRCPP